MYVPVALGRVMRVMWGSNISLVPLEAMILASFCLSSLSLEEESHTDNPFIEVALGYDEIYMRTTIP
jgi:hypothetical protein